MENIMQDRQSHPKPFPSSLNKKGQFSLLYINMHGDQNEGHPK